MKIGIIGAGISGLTTAYYLQQRNIDYTLLEGSSQAGGYLRSVREGNYLLDIGANSLLCDPPLIDFLHEIGLTDALVVSNVVSKNRFILKNGRYHALPASPLKLLFNPFFSWHAKKAIGKELRNRTVSPPQESVSQFFERHFCKEIVEYAVNPFVRGIYAGNPEELLIAATFPSLLAYEQTYGSILKGFIKNKVGGRKQTVSFAEGMQQLPLHLAQKVKVQYQTTVQRLSRHASQWHVHTHNGSTLVFDKVIVSTPAYQTADFVATDFPDFAAALRQVVYPPMAAVHTAYKKTQVKQPLNGFGGLHPTVEQRFSAGVIWSSSIFAGRCPTDEVLLTAFVGGRLQEHHYTLPDQALLAQLNTELAALYGIEGLPTFQKISRWQRAIPQYDRHILPVQTAVEQLQSQQLYVAANWYKGISLADCIRKAKELAESL